LPQDLRDVDGDGEHNRVGDQVQELDRLLLQLRIPAGQQAVAAERQSLGEAIEHLGLVRGLRDLVPQSGLGQILQQDGRANRPALLPDSPASPWPVLPEGGRWRDAAPSRCPARRGLT
jgi:hypothetical protein